MAKQPLLFVQGTGEMRSPEGSGILATYLQDTLGESYGVIAPEMPDAAIGPHYRPWRDRIDEELRGLNGPVLLVGHSFGGSVVLKYLAEGDAAPRIGGLFLIAVPWWGPEGWNYEEYAMPADFAAGMPAIPTFLYHSTDDPHVPIAHLHLYRQQLPQAIVRVIPGAEHSFVHGLPQLVADIRSLAR